MFPSRHPAACRVGRSAGWARQGYSWEKFDCFYSATPHRLFQAACGLVTLMCLMQQALNPCFLDCCQQCAGNIDAVCCAGNVRPRYWDRPNFRRRCARNCRATAKQLVLRVGTTRSCGRGENAKNFSLGGEHLPTMHILPVSSNYGAVAKYLVLAEKIYIKLQDQFVSSFVVVPTLVLNLYNIMCCPELPFFSIPFR